MRSLNKAMLSRGLCVTFTLKWWDVLNTVYLTQYIKALTVTIVTTAHPAILPLWRGRDQTAALYVVLKISPRMAENLNQWSCTNYLTHLNMVTVFSQVYTGGEVEQTWLVANRLIKTHRDNSTIVWYPCHRAVILVCPWQDLSEMDGRMGGCMGGWVNWSVDGWTHACLDRQTERWTEWMHRLMDRWMHACTQTHRHKWMNG